MSQQKVGRYEIKSELGRGGMATVYRGYDPTFEREVAIKVISRQFLNDPTFRTRFEREAKTIAMLEHPGILPVYDTGEDNNQPYIVMRLMLGGTLAERLQKQPFTLPEIVQWINQLAPALDYAHSKGVIHRDLKPANILFDSEGNPCISDFGIAKLAQQTSGMTGSGVLGTPSYMSPEQARGETEIDARADLYAFGVILFEMLTGQQPFVADTPFGVAMKHITDPIPRLLDQNPNLPAACQEILEGAMAKEREQRFYRAVEIAQRLESVARGESLLPYSPSTADTQVRKPITGSTQTRKPKTEPHVVSPTQEGKAHLNSATLTPEHDSEIELTSFKCPNCGAPIDIQRGTNAIKCAYCNASIIIPRELRIKVEVNAAPKETAAKPVEPPPPPPPPLPLYKKPLLGAELSALVAVMLISCIVFFVFLGAIAGIDIARLGVASLAPALTTATPQGAAATAVAATPLASRAPLPTPTGATLVFEGGTLFSDPQALDFDGNGNVYVSDGKSAQVFRLDTSGKRLTQWKVETKNNYGARSLTSDKFGNVYFVVDNVLFKYNGIAGLLQSRLTDAPYIEVANFADGSFVASTNRDEVVRFNVNSQVVFRVNKAISSQSDKPETQLRLATDTNGNFYVAGSDNNLIVKYAPDGKFLIRFGLAGDGLGQFKNITSLVADARNKVYVSDAKGIQIFDADGKYLSLLRTNGVVSNLALNEKGELFGTIGDKVFKFTLP